jgi:hypothetical protein
MSTAEHLLANEAEGHQFWQRLSIAFEFAAARRWRKRHPECSAPQSVGVMVPAKSKTKRP